MNSNSPTGSIFTYIRNSMNGLSSLQKNADPTFPDNQKENSDLPTSVPNISSRSKLIFEPEADNSAASSYADHRISLPVFMHHSTLLSGSKQMPQPTGLQDMNTPPSNENCYRRSYNGSISVQPSLSKNSSLKLPSSHHHRDAKGDNTSKRSLSPMQATVMAHNEL